MVRESNFKQVLSSELRLLMSGMDIQRNDNPGGYRSHSEGKGHKYRATVSIIHYFF